MEKSGYFKITPVNSKSQGRIFWKTGKFVKLDKEDDRPRNYEVFIGLFVMQPTPAYKPKMFLTISNSTGKVRIPFSSLSQLFEFIDILKNFTDKQSLSLYQAFSKVKSIWEVWQKRDLDIIKEIVTKE